jgi:hypothetical protein
MRKKIAVALTVAMMSALMVGAPAFAHVGAGDPCSEAAPGHSTYAMHHIVPLATTGGLGAGGHIPGEHHGYAGLCGVQAP